MKYFYFILAFIFSTALMAMPCDTGYHCKSKSFEIEIQTCRYENKVTLRSLKMDEKNLEGAQLGAAYDGSFDKGPLNFEILLPAESGTKLATVEIPAAKHIGTVKLKFLATRPGSFTTLKKESITCKRN